MNKFSPFFFSIIFSSFTVGVPFCSFASVPDGYKGTPFTSHVIPRTVEAEDFDNGGSGVAYHYVNGTSGGNKTYRPNDAVSISPGNGGIVLGNTDDGDWTNYTIDVSEDGDYSITTIASSGATGMYKLLVDGVTATRTMTVPNNGWDNYTEVVTSGVHLLKGKHLFQWYTYGGMNVDKFIFKRTGKFTGNGTSQGGFNYTYPITQTYDSNPLLTGFPSPMYDSPFAGNMYACDPSAHVWNINGKEVLYLYASHDIEPCRGCDRMDRYHVFSTEDLKTWTDWGEIFNADDVKAQTGVGSNGFMWAPDAAFNKKDGKYYVFFPHKIKSKADGDDDDVWRIFVARSKKPATDFKILGYIDGIPSTIDPCVFVDDDGEAYIYTSGAGKGVWGCKLNSKDWTKLDGTMTPQQGLTNVHEAPWAFKKDGKYYLTYSDGHSTDLGGNQLLYAISDNPLGPWDFKGVYMYPYGDETAHGSVVKFKGQWYQFYHTSDYSGTGALRSTCIAPVTFNSDGTMNPVHTWGVSAFDALPEVSTSDTTRIEAENFNKGGRHVGWWKMPGNAEFEAGNLQYSDIETTTKGNVTYLKDMKRREWVRYSFRVAKTGRYTIRCRMRQNNSADAKFRVGVDGSWVKSTEIPVASSRNAWGNTEIKNVELTEGEHYLEWRCTNGDIDLDWIEIGENIVKIPGTIEAEDYDDDAYSFRDKVDGNAKNYRRDQGVAISSSNGVTHISNTNNGDWLKYTFFSPGGVFTITSHVAAQSGGKFYLSIDDTDQLSDTFNVSTGDWQAYRDYSWTKVVLPKGVHTMRIHIVSGTNLDNFVFRRTGNIPTEINTVTAPQSSIGTIYNLQGIRQTYPQRGIYIQGGKKKII